MAEALLILSFLLFGQLGDRYPSEQSASPLSEGTAELESLDQSPEEPSSSVDSPSQSELFDYAPQAPADLSGPVESQTNGKSQAIESSESMKETAQPTTTNPPQTTAASDPATLVEDFNESVSGSQLSGTPVSLVEVITSASSRQEQTRRVEDYWNLSRAVLDYNLASKEKIELAALRRGIIQASPQWDHAMSMVEARQQLALQAAHIAQRRLAGLLSSTSEGFAPIPSDLPFVGTYNTRYSELFPQQDNSFQLNSQLAEKYDQYLIRVARVIENEAKDISDSREWMFAVSEQRNPNTDGRELLAAYELFAANRRLFVQTVIDYNRGIVRYTELATPGSVEPQRLVAMLIRVDTTAMTTVDPAVQRTNAEEQMNGNSQPRSTAENSWHALPNNSERSILVPSR